MGYKNREIEKKYVVADSKHTFKKVCDLVDALFKNTIFSEKGSSKDFYWHSPRPSAADFIRLRNMPDGTGQLTLKRADRGSNINRIEIDVEIPNPKQTHKFLNQLLGRPVGTIHKDYSALFIDNNETSVSVYKIKGNPKVFIEIEARSLSLVNKISKQISSVIEMRQEKRSLYQLFFRETK
jgi:adenylate cyclase class IV